LSGKKPSNRVDRDSNSFPSKTGEIAGYETLKVFKLFLSKTGEIAGYETLKVLKTFKVWSFGSAIISNL
jgi:hypothetical protein